MMRDMIDVFDAVIRPRMAAALAAAHSVSDEERWMDDVWFDHLGRLLAGDLPRRAIGLATVAAFGNVLFPANVEGKRRCRRRNQGATATVNVAPAFVAHCSRVPTRLASAA
jgi:hypothetical protein